MVFASTRWKRACVGNGRQTHALGFDEKVEYKTRWKDQLQRGQVWSLWAVQRKPILGLAGVKSDIFPYFLLLLLYMATFEYPKTQSDIGKYPAVLIVNDF